jgi:hypothetical protein
MLICMTDNMNEQCMTYFIDDHLILILKCIPCENDTVRLKKYFDN